MCCQRIALFLYPGYTLYSQHLFPLIITRDFVTPFPRAIEMSYPYYWHVPFRPLRDKYALFGCLIIYLSPVNGFIIVFILCLHTRPGAFLIWYTMLFPHMAPALYATVRTHIYYGLIRYCMRDQQSRGHGLPWPQLDTIAITFLSRSLSCLPPSGGSFGFRLSCLVLSISSLELS